MNQKVVLWTTTVQGMGSQTFDIKTKERVRDLSKGEVVWVTLPNEEEIRVCEVTHAQTQKSGVRIHQMRPVKTRSGSGVPTVLQLEPVS